MVLRCRDPNSVDGKPRPGDREDPRPTVTLSRRDPRPTVPLPLCCSPVPLARGGPLCPLRSDGEVSLVPTSVHSQFGCRAPTEGCGKGPRDLPVDRVVTVDSPESVVSTHLSHSGPETRSDESCFTGVYLGRRVRRPVVSTVAKDLQGDWTHGSQRVRRGVGAHGSSVTPDTTQVAGRPSRLLVDQVYGTGAGESCPVTHWSWESGESHGVTPGVAVQRRGR